MTTSISVIDTSAPPTVRWEPCSEFHEDAAAEAVGACAGCGWPPDDHELPVAA
ncbi:MAG TPA: hypothetical protein VIH82_09665 [Acidimicrobiia bacterium]|jgi:hypothetical protein